MTHLPPVKIMCRPLKQILGTLGGEKKKKEKRKKMSG
jgi:hypothetical protein